MFLAGMCLATISQAGVIFQDDFNSENGGKYFLNYDNFANWTVSNGTVDIIGEKNNWDYFPTYGLYVDLDGSTSSAGVLTTKDSFAAGSYMLQFDLAGSQRDGINGDYSNTVDIYLGSWHTSVTRYSADPMATFTFTFYTDGGSLVFHNQGGDNVGAILDNVKVSSVPIPGTLMLLGSSLLGLAGIRRRMK
jgi:hypothetical protein